VRKEAVDEIWCLGDIVGYGPQPNRCVEEARARSDLCLLGNHDLAAIGDVDLSSFSPDAATSARWTIDVLEPEALEYLRSLEPKGEREGVELFHASPRDPIWEYVLSEPAARAALEMTTGRLVLVGHSHIPIALRLSDGNALAGGLAKGGSEIELDEGRWLLNPGSVGQPRDGDPRAAYLLVDLERWTAQYRRIPYNIRATQSEIRKAGLPEALAERLEVGE
jgi:diadenosine tetraphosphatase ApaH/serine/threonine PP2A family protein phosphatase